MLYDVYMYYLKCSLVHLSRKDKHRPLRDILAGKERPAEEEEEQEDQEDDDESLGSVDNTQQVRKGKKAPRATPITRNPIIRDNEDHIAEWMRATPMLYDKMNKHWMNVDLKNGTYTLKADSLSKEYQDKHKDEDETPTPITGADLQKYVSCMRTRIGKITADRKKKKSGDSGKAGGDKKKTDRDGEITKMWSFLQEHITRQRSAVACGVSKNV